MRVPSNVFEIILGLPAHPLLLHAAVVFLPLMVLAALVYALVPAVRARIAWAVVGLAVVGPLCALFAKLSGDAFRRRLIRLHRTSPELLSKISQHQSFGTTCVYLAVVLGVLMLALVLLRTPPRLVSLALVVLAVGFSVATGYYVFRTGDSGARIVWSGS